MKILFIYPNQSTELRIPLALSILIACVRKSNHEAKLFDPTFMGEFKTDNESMSRLGTHHFVDLDIMGNNLNPEEELKRMVGDYKPDFIAISLVERNFFTAKRLIQALNTKIPVLCGGIMPTIAPQFVNNEAWVDMICLGEGEGAIVDLLNYPNESIPNIWTKTDINYLRDLVNLDEIPEQDWSDFDKRHLSKPFMGKVYRGGAFEFSRGCGKSCAFCVAPQIRRMSEGLGKYHRTKSPENCISEIENKCNQYGLQMISFGDTDFLSGVPKKTMMTFLSLYSSRIGLPFTIQSGVETLNDDDLLQMLRQAKCCAISVGVESGSERIRKSIIKKFITNDYIKRVFDKCRNYGLRLTANYMTGLPDETEEDIRETIKLNTLLNPPSIAVTYFTPFMGTDLYDFCIERGYYKPFKAEENIYEYPPLTMPQLSQERIIELTKEFAEEFKTHQKDFSIL